jgi:hypothetical protein
MTRWLTTRTRRASALVALTLCGLAAWSGSAVAATDGSYQDVYVVNSCATSASVNNAPMFAPTTFGAGMATADACGSLGGLQITASQGTNNGSWAQWAATTPSPAIQIIGVTASGMADCNLGADGFNAFYVWGTLSANYGSSPITIDCHGGAGNSNAGAISQKIQPSTYLGWRAQCTKTGGCTPTGANGLVFAGQSITLEAQETSGPALSPSGTGNLFGESGWIRGTLGANVSVADPSGVCAITTTANGSALNSYTDPSPDTSSFTQCSGTALGASVDTTKFPNGAGAITLLSTATNAAGATSTISHPVNVDNQTPTVVLSGPSDAPITAGTQYVNATATAGPSGAQGIWCSLDGAGYTEHSGSSAQIPVSGLGAHQVSCYSESNALDVNGNPARSSTASFSMTIRQPTEAAVSFSTLKDPLRCQRVTVRVPGKRRIVVRHGRKVSVRGRATRRRELRCKARTVARIVTVVERRHGKSVRVRQPERVVVLPHHVNKLQMTVPFGSGATVNGVLLTTNGTPIAGQSVEVLTAPNNGLRQFTPATSAVTSSAGTWTAHLPGGPSRLILASYGGSTTLEPIVSNTAQLTVPARIAVAITPRQLLWHGTITVHGHLVGGYVPADGVALRLLVRYPNTKKPTPLLALRTTSTGQFAITWSYHHGRGVATFPFTIATTATESDFPFAASSSTPIDVTLGKATPDDGGGGGGQRGRRPRAHHGKTRR